ncbi:hypothetical protein Pyn_38416 [Prunus yedoensis var. nudiflora]|uniref:Uncharacterized protein n=1 Tax=Prunus yedoensis var. nudiflora TaxID=2094558 RepID=A0A314USG3_PRUYE|nr:hypothetical protein Pyn_38416 [Prunus yedoensis var. nudiflora]
MKKSKKQPITQPQGIGRRSGGRDRRRGGGGRLAWVGVVFVVKIDKVADGGLRDVWRGGRKLRRGAYSSLHSPGNQRRGKEREERMVWWLAVSEDWERGLKKMD